MKLSDRTHAQFVQGFVFLIPSTVGVGGGAEIEKHVFLLKSVEEIDWKQLAQTICSQLFFKMHSKPIKRKIRNSYVLQVGLAWKKLVEMRNLKIMHVVMYYFQLKIYKYAFICHSFAGQYVFQKEW